MIEFLPDYAPSAALTWTFIGLVALVVVIDVWLVRRAAPPERRSRWTAWALGASTIWLAVHALVAESGITQGLGLPPPALLYLAINIAVAVWLVRSTVGHRLAALPLALLVGVQAFRVPLELWLHAMYAAGELPVQMTFTGYNFDIVTGITAAALGLALWRGTVPRAVVWAWNVMGLVLLVVVVGIAATSAPGAIRQFAAEPPLVLVFHAPFSWIASVHVWTALVLHLLVFRALRARA